MNNRADILERLQVLADYFDTNLMRDAIDLINTQRNKIIWLERERRDMSEECQELSRLLDIEREKNARLQQVASKMMTT